VNFTADDLARTRFSAAPAPLGETWLALVELRRAGVDRRRMRARPWLREAGQAFPRTARPLLDLFGTRPPWPDFVDSLAPDLTEALDFVRGTSREYLIQTCREGRSVRHSLTPLGRTILGQLRPMPRELDGRVG
jgi:hypothetical protein